MRIIIFALCFSFACLNFVCVNTASVQAQTLKGRLTVKGDSTIDTDFSLVAQTKSEKIQSTNISADGKFTLTGVSTTDRLSVLFRSNYHSPLVLGVKRGKKFKSFIAAKRSNFCSSGRARVILSTKKKLRGALKIEIDKELGLAYLKTFKKNQRKQLLKGVSATAATNCLPAGLADANSVSQVRSFASVSDDPNDADGDGQSNEEDIDDDDDGVSDAFDPDNDGDGIIDDSDTDNNDRSEATQLFYFQQLHLDRENSYHPKLQTVTTEMIDNALVDHGGLALEVKDGGTAELNCGADEVTGSTGLSWCSEGGTGRTREPYPDGAEFPEAYDSDANGKGEIVAGGSGDFQLVPGATSSQIQPGDAFIEEVDDGSGTITKYVGVLNSVVLSVPGIETITTGVSTYTLDYPPTSGSIGTYSNPILVPATGDVSVTFNLYPPVYNTSAGEIVPGIMTIGLQLPNGPCTYNPTTQMCSGSGSGPGLLPGSLYSDPSSGWTVESDGVRSSFTDKSVDESTSMSFTINLTGTDGVSGWDPEEYLKVPVQAFDNNGTTSAHNVIFKRQAS